MKYLIMGIFILVGLINIAPLMGVISAERLTALYGLEFKGPDLLILMRHRAVLFGLLGAFLIAAAFLPEWRNAAMVAGFVSMLAFIGLAFMIGEHSAVIRKLVLADVFACVLLAIVPLGRFFAPA